MLNVDEISIKDIEIERIYMNLTRFFTIPLPGSKQKERAPVYLKVTYPLTIYVKSNSNRLISKLKTKVSTVLPSRYPLLDFLVEEFSDALDGVNSLWAITTILSNLYSLVRGYQQYTTGEPINVVDNHHLSPIVNIGILLDEAMYFGGVDPLAIVETLRKVRNSNISRSAILNKMENNTIFNINDIHESGYHSVPASIIDFSEIGKSILYTSVETKLVFKKNDDLITLLIGNSGDFEEIVNNYTKRGYVLVDSLETSLIRNKTMEDKLREIISRIYTANMKTHIVHEDSTVIYGDHYGYPIDNGTSGWILEEYSLLGEKGKPPRGDIKPGSILYEAIYEVRYIREHSWCRMNGNNTSCTMVFDIKNEKVRVDIVLDYYSSYRDTKNDILEVFYWNESIGDPNLADTVEDYREQVLSNPSTLLGKTDGFYYSRDVTGLIPSWVLDRCLDRLDEVQHYMEGIKLPRGINTSTYPNPVELLKTAKEAFIDKLKPYAKQLEDRSYITASSKAVACCEYWFMQEVMSRINKSVESMVNSIMDKLNYKLEDETSALDVLTNSIGEQLVVPLSIPLWLDNGWGEKVTIAVTHQPHYLDPFKEFEYNGKKNYHLGIRNTCLFGSTGVPILPPTTVTPWIVTLNTWLIEVKGYFAEFKVLDTNGETLFSPIFGHKPLTYIRKEDIVRDEDGVILGYNKPLFFEFTTVAFSVVPPWGPMVGERDDKFVESNGLYLIDIS